MKTKTKIALILFLFIINGIDSLLVAQNIPKSLEECIQIALDNNLILKSRKIAIEKTKEMQGTAFNIDRTGFSLSQDPSTGGSPDNSLSISQSFDFPTVYTARHSMLKAETNLERTQFNLSRNELLKEVTSNYYELLYTQETIRILKNQDSIYAKFVYIATAKLNTGESNRLEQMNAERLYNENRLALQKEEGKFTNMQLLLQKWLNTEELIVPAEDKIAILNTSDFLFNLTVSQTPFYQLYESRKEISNKNIRLQKNQFLPSFNFTLKNQYLINGFNPYNITRNRFTEGNFMGFELGIGLPLFFGEQRAKVRAANKEHAIISMQQQDASLSLEKEFEAGLNEYRQAKNSLDYFLNIGNKQAKEIIRIAQLSYEKGEINYLEYIQNLKTVIDINLQYAYAINEYNQTVIKLKYLQGNN